MDASTLATVISAVSVFLTAFGALITTILSRRDRRDREVDRIGKKTEIKKIEEDIVKRSTQYAIEVVEEQLANTRRALQEAYQEATALRTQLALKNDHIEEQDALIRRLTRRAGVLEDWIEDNCDRFKELGIDGLPDDVQQDRRKSRF